MDGILPVWKPRGMTSHDVVFKLRKILSTKKIGHTGTLDPEVEGVLVTCIGRATRLVEFLMDGYKIYEGEVTLGYSTETEDQTGAIVEVKKLTQPIPSQLIQEKMDELIGRITQTPPMYSAVKVDGKRLYEYARAGQEVQRPTRQVDVYSFDLTSDPVYDASSGTQRFNFKIKCGKGTYVRTLSVDLGEKLGYPSHMSYLERTASDGFTSSDTYTLEEIQEASLNSRLDEIIRPIEDSLQNFPRIDIQSPQAYEDIYHSRVLASDYFGQEMKEMTAMFYQGEFLGFYQPHPSKPGHIKPRKMFV